jgi:hypothetical protein
VSWLQQKRLPRLRDACVAGDDAGAEASKID